MSSAPHDPFRLPVRVLAAVGLAALAALTLPDRSATRMFAVPWIWGLAGLIALPPTVLLLRLAAQGREFRFPPLPWLTGAAIAGLGPVVSALFSPYRGPSLLAAGLPFASACLLLVLHDWLQNDPPRNRLRLGRLLAAGAAVIALASTVYWLDGAMSLDRERLLSGVLFEIRNPHPLGHSNYTAGLMLLALPWLGWLAWCSHGWLRGGAAAATALALLNLFMSGSRGGLIGLAALAMASVGLSRPGWKRFLPLAAGAVVAAALLAVANPRIRAMLEPASPDAAPNASHVQRSAMLAAGLAMGADRPVLGWGPGTTPLAYPRYRHALDGGVENALQLHSTPLQLWAEMGATGLLAVLLLGGLAAVNWSRSPRAAATLAGYGVFALTDYQLDVPIFAAAVTVLLAWLIPPTGSPASSAGRFGAAIAVLAAASVILSLGARDPAPALNCEALRLARDPARHAEAVALLEQSLALNPDQEIARFNLGWLLLVSDPARAESHFLAAARLVPDKGGVYFGLGLARLNQGNRPGAARAFALECLNEPLFLASPWWTVPEIAALRAEAAHEYSALLHRAFSEADNNAATWAGLQARQLATLAPRLGRVSPGPEASYRRRRVGYPVLMRNPDLPPAVDLYDVREDPRFPASVPFVLPHKGWLPGPRLLKLLDATPSASQ